MGKESDEPASTPPPPLVVRNAKISPSVINQACANSVRKSTPKLLEEDVVSTSSSSNGGYVPNVSSDEDFGYYRRKSRVAGNGSNKSRNNRKK
jgi:hypothetical protein